jgi:hypothetical protein
LLNKISLYILLSGSFLFSQSKFFFQPSAYFTYGSYSDKSNSKQYSVYSLFSWNNYDYLVLGYDRIEISNRLNIYNWNYKQNNFSGGFHYWFSDLNLKLKLDFLKIDGRYKDNAISYSLLDKGYLVSPEFISGVYPFYYGVGFCYLKQSGKNKLNANQLYLRTDYYPHYKVLLNSILSSHFISDGRKQASLQLSIFYFPVYELSIKGSFSIGSRSIYYNPDLMVLYNQLETQTSNYSFQVNYNFYKNIVASIQYQKANFSSYQINYIVFGIKSSFYF